MNVWTNTEFEGFWPVGVAAVVVADDAEEAALLLNDELKRVGLRPIANAKQFVRMPTHIKGAVILNNGDY